MRRLLVWLVALAVLVAGLLAQAAWDSVNGTWVAMGALFALVAIRLAAWLGLWPADWPDAFGDGD